LAPFHIIFSIFTRLRNNVPASPDIIHSIIEIGMKIQEADITYKVRGSQFEFIKMVYLEEKETCSMKIQKVVFGDFFLADFPKKEFERLLSHLDQCKVPFPGHSDGKSGDHHVLDIQSGENSMVYNWYGDSPGEQWKDINAFVSELIKLKEKYIQ